MLSRQMGTVADSLVCMKHYFPWQQLRVLFFSSCEGPKAKKSATKRKQPGEAPESGSRPINGHPHGRITGVDMRHLLLLPPFLLFDLLDDDISQYNTGHATYHVGPVQVLISVVLALLEWYHLYRQAKIACLKWYCVLLGWKLNIMCSIEKCCKTL